MDSLILKGTLLVRGSETQHTAVLLTQHHEMMAYRFFSSLLSVFIVFIVVCIVSHHVFSVLYIPLHFLLCIIKVNLI